MIRIMSYAVLLAVFAAFAFGCSASEPVTTPMEPVRVTSTDSHELLGYYRLMINPSIPSVEVIQVRQIAFDPHGIRRYEHTRGAAIPSSQWGVSK